MALSDDEIRRLAREADTDAATNALALQIVAERGGSMAAAYQMIALARGERPL